MKKKLLLAILVFLISVLPVFSDFSKDFIGVWEIKTNLAIIEDYLLPFNTESPAAKGFAYLIASEYISDPNIFIKLDFKDEDLLYIHKKNGEIVRGFYTIESSPEHRFTPFKGYISMVTKHGEKYMFSLAEIDNSKNHFKVSYKLDHISDIKGGEFKPTVYCLGELIKQQ